jgi:hypothetical protein
VLNAQTPRGQLLLGIAIFAGVSAALIAYIAFSFGWTKAGGAALILLLPVYVGLRISCRRTALQEQELAYLLMAVLFAAIGVFGLMGSWESAGMRYRYAEAGELDRMDQQLRRDPAFRDVTGYISSKPGYGRAPLWLDGKVPSADDLARLEALVSQSRFEWSMHVEVAGEKAKPAE